MSAGGTSDSQKFRKALRRLASAWRGRVALVLAVLLGFGAPLANAGPCPLPAVAQQQNIGAGTGAQDAIQTATPSHCRHATGRTGGEKDHQSPCHGDCCPCCDLDDFANAAFPAMVETPYRAVHAKVSFTRRTADFRRRAPASDVRLRGPPILV